MEFKIEGSLNLADQNQVRAAIAFLSALQANPATETEVKKLNVVEAEVVAPAAATAELSPAAKGAATKAAKAEAAKAAKAEAAKAAAAKKEEPTNDAEEETPAAEAAREEAPEESPETEAAAIEKAEQASSADFSKDDCREVLGAISLAGHKNEIKALLNTQFGVSSITSLSDDQVDKCYAALKKMAGELKVKLD